MVITPTLPRLGAGTRPNWIAHKCVIQIRGVPAPSRGRVGVITIITNFQKFEIVWNEKISYFWKIDFSGHFCQFSGLCHFSAVRCKLTPKWIWTCFASRCGQRKATTLYFATKWEIRCVTVAEWKRCPFVSNLSGKGGGVRIPIGAFNDNPENWGSYNSVVFFVHCAASMAQQVGFAGTRS